MKFELIRRRTMYTDLVIVAAFLLVLVPGSALCCTDGQRCITDKDEPGTCQNGACATHNATEVGNMTLRIVVKYPDEKLRENGGRYLYIRGSGLGLTWTSGQRLQKVNQDTWSYELFFRSSISGIQCVTCTTSGYIYLLGNRLQYRVLVDDKIDMLRANFVIDFPVSRTSTYFNEKPDFVVYPWFFSKTGKIGIFNKVSNRLGKRNVSLYLPPSYSENTLKSYPVFTVFDFTVLTKDIIEGPIYPHKVAEEYVIVGFDDYGNASGSRMQMLTQTPGYYYKCINGTLETLCDGCIPMEAVTNATELVYYLEKVCTTSFLVGGDGDKMLDFLVEEAVPKAAEITNQRIQTKYLGIMGYSLGGLMSCYAAWTRPYVFKMAACQSSSFFWPMDNSLNKTFEFLNVTLADVNLAKYRTGNQKIYIDVGSEEDLPGYRLTTSAIEVADVISGNDEYMINQNLWLHVAPGDAHGFPAWLKRFWVAVSTLLPVKGDLDMPESNSSNDDNKITNDAVMLTSLSKYGIIFAVVAASFMAGLGDI